MSDKFGLTRISMLILLATLAACGSSGGSGTTGGSGGTAKFGSGGGSASTGSGGNTTTTSGGGDVAATPSVSAPSAPASAPSRSGTVDFSATFPYLGQFTNGNSDGLSNDGMWWVEQKSWGRAAVVNIGRDGGTALRLHTDPGDNNVSGSGNFERNDVALQYTNSYQGDEQWWAHSILFPDDYAVTPWDQPTARAVVFNFHDTRNQGGQANFHVVVEPGGLLTFVANGGPTVVGDQGNEYSYGADIGQIQKNVWYDFVYHVRWSAYGDGYLQAWVNGVKKLDHYGPTLYEGYGVYLKLANYHTAFGQSSSVIHDRVIRGTTWDAVSLTSLEGVY